MILVLIQFGSIQVNSTQGGSVNFGMIEVLKKMQLNLARLNST